MNDFIGKDVTLQVFDELGRLITSLQLDQLSESTLKLNIADYNDGLYFINIQAANTQPLVKRFVKIK